jgi:hypothetical protein
MTAQLKNINFDRAGDDGIVFQNVPAGPLLHCQITGSEDLHPVLDLGAQPLCDALLNGKDEPETHYPLSFNVCCESGLGQLGYVLDPDEVYPATYPYRAGISHPVRDHMQKLAADAIEKFQNGNPIPLVVDIGSNDGTLLSFFKAAGWRCLGVEPTNIADIAKAQNDIYTRKEFFDEAVAEDIVSAFGSPLLVTMTNVFAHMTTLADVMLGLKKLMRGRADTVLIVENHYLLDVLEGVQFDTVYHEHVRTYSLRSLQILFKQWGLEVFDVERVARYGGNIRVFVAVEGHRPVNPRVKELADLEVRRGLFLPARWDRWREAVQYARSQMMEYLYVGTRQGKSFAGCSAPGRASTMINYYGIGPDLVRYLGELPDSLKLGKFVPGARIPIIENKALIEDQPDYVVLFAWHYADVIADRLRREGLKSKLLVPLPEVRVLG